MTVKTGAQIDKLHPEITRALKVIDLLWQAFFPEDISGLTITSGHEGIATDGTHGPSSKHYLSNNISGLGEAVDIRLNDVSSRKATAFCGLVAFVLNYTTNIHYDVFAERILTQSAHLHLEL